MNILWSIQSKLLIFYLLVEKYYRTVLLFKNKSRFYIHTTGSSYSISILHRTIMNMGNDFPYRYLYRTACSFGIIQKNWTCYRWKVLILQSINSSNVIFKIFSLLQIPDQLPQTLFLLFKTYLNGSNLPFDQNRRFKPSIWS